MSKPTRKFPDPIPIEIQLDHSQKTDRQPWPLTRQRQSRQNEWGGGETYMTPFLTFISKPRRTMERRLPTP